ncbi:MAG: DUF1538 domain-containing protein [Pseudomonadota bacterium]
MSADYVAKDKDIFADMMNSSTPDSQRYHLGLRDSMRVLWPYVKRNFMSQLEGVWFIVLYLIAFQILILNLPIVYSLMIAAGIFVVVIGLMFFMEGLRLGLMPLGEVIGSMLPRKSNMAVILGFAFLLGIGATFAEPAIAVLKAAGSGIVPEQAPLLYSLLNDFSGQLVGSVGVGVGLAVMLGVLRFFYAWPLKFLAIPIVLFLLMMSFYFSQVPALRDVLGLAWDCGAVTTGPVTVPLVLALGIGVCRVVNSGSGGEANGGFGIVTLASLFPILAVMLLALYHHSAGDYYGAPNYRGELLVQAKQAAAAPAVVASNTVPISDAEFDEFLSSGNLPEGYSFEFRGGESQLVDGKIVVSNHQMVVKKTFTREFELFSDKTWDTSQSIQTQVQEAGVGALRAIVPLCLFLFFVLRMVLKQRLNRDSDVGTGIAFALFGMGLFGLGITLGLTPLGGQLGSNIPLAFTSIIPWGQDFAEAPLFLSEHAGKLLAIGFAFFLGYGATLAEPALNALGDTVERITVGAFRKKLLMQSVAIGVGLGIGAGVVKMAFNLPLVWMIIPPYLLVLVLTWRAPDSFVNFGWDSAGVTTGPITVPLVLAMGLGIGSNVPGVIDGFGILALASVGPILTVLSVGLYTQRSERREYEAAEEAELTDDFGVAIKELGAH